MSEIAKAPVPCHPQMELLIDPVNALVNARQGDVIAGGTPPGRVRAGDRSSPLAGSLSDYVLLLSVRLMT